MPSRPYPSFSRFFQEGLTDASSNAKTEKNHAWDEGVTEEFVDSIALMVRKEGAESSHKVGAQVKP